jgi:hypothetical protein
MKPDLRYIMLKSVAGTLLKGLVIVLLVVPAYVFSQNNKFSYDSELNPYAQRTANVFYPDIIPETQSVEDFLTAYLPSFNKGKAKLIRMFSGESPYGKHYLFLQQLNGIPVYNSYIKVNIDRYGRIYSVYDNSYSIENYDYTDVTHETERLKQSGSAEFFERNFTNGYTILLKEINLAYFNDTLLPVWRYQIYRASPPFFREYLLNQSGEIVLSIDLNIYRNQATAQAFVFLPDPLTRARQYYHPPFVNYNNGYNPSLDSQAVMVDIWVTEHAGIHTLENNYVRISDFDEPYWAPVQSNVPQFFFDRSQSGFEDVNVLYHITSFQQYIQTLGFNLANYQIAADAHALNGDDNSLFSPATNPPRLYFGIGGVEDAEDADVIVHEYCHALSHSANNSNIGDERRAIDEGLCDYFATSYSKSIDTFRWADMFTWDGHNEYWSGRSAAVTKRYPNDLSQSIHANGEIWSSALMQIWDEAGKTVTDQLMLQTLYALAPNMKMNQAARELIKADSIMFNGAHFCAIYHAFLKYGLIDSLPEAICAGFDKNLHVDAGEDVLACAGDSVRIGGNNLTSSDYTYLWSPADGVAHIHQPQTMVRAAANTTYTLRITTSGGRYNEDTVKVTIRPCNISVYNTHGFAEGSSMLKIFVPLQYDKYSVGLYDAAGKKIMFVENLQTNIHYLDGRELSPGVYFLSIYTNDKAITFRLLKF